MLSISRKSSPGLIILVIGFAALLVLAFYLILNGKLNADEGFYLLASRSVNEGLRPYKDFGYTQGPVLPYVDIPWLDLFGYDLTGQRLTSFVWLFSTTVVCCVYLIRYNSIRGAALFTLLLIGAPNAVAYLVKGKTYAFASLTLVLGVIVLRSALAVRVRWILFVLCGGIGVGARLPLAGFFVPGAIYLLGYLPGWKTKLAAVTFAAVCAAIELLAFGHGAWANFYFWTVQFHRESLFEFSLAQRYIEAARSAPGVWIVSAGAFMTAAIKRNIREAAVFLCLFCGVFANLCTKTTYAEYVFPFVPALALAGVLYWFNCTKDWRVFTVVCGVVLLGGLVRLPDLRRGLLINTGQVVAFVREVAPANSVSIASMPEIPVAAGLQVPRELVMGKFSLTEEMSDSLARKRLMLTPASLCELIENPVARTVIVSPAYNWSFYWSVPSYRPLSVESQNQIRRAINRHFRVGLVNDDYVVFVRTDVDAPLNKQAAN